MRGGGGPQKSFEGNASFDVECALTALGLFVPCESLKTTAFFNSLREGKPTMRIDFCDALFQDHFLLVIVWNLLRFRCDGV